MLIGTDMMVDDKKHMEILKIKAEVYDLIIKVEKLKGEIGEIQMQIQKKTAKIRELEK